MLSKGYRCDSLYGSSVTDAIAIVNYEVNEMCNSDIFDYCNEKYGVDKNVDSLVEFLIEKFGTDKLNALWLCDSLSDVLNSYIEDDVASYLDYIYEDSSLEYEIIAYRIPKNAIIISDLEEAGKLYVSDIEFEPIVSVEYKYYKDGTILSNTIQIV